MIVVGNGNNKKSMAYVENVAAFLEWSLQRGKGVHIYNYIDKPDFDMNALVSISRKILFGKVSFISLTFHKILINIVFYRCALRPAFIFYLL